VSRIPEVEALVDEARQAVAAGGPPDDGLLLVTMCLRLRELGIDDPSFCLARLGRKERGEVVRCLKIFALCPYKGECWP
jgi:hypothetical protein